jgi:hypothetical protein
VARSEAVSPGRGTGPGLEPPSLKKVLNESGRQRPSAYTSPKSDSVAVSNSPISILEAVGSDWFLTVYSRNLL